MRKEYDFKTAKRGPVVKVPKGKTRITIRLDEDIVAWFKEQVHRAGGGNYQSLINAALRDHVRHAGEPLEATLRRVLRARPRPVNEGWLSLDILRLNKDGKRRFPRIAGIATCSGVGTSRHLETRCLFDADALQRFRGNRGRNGGGFIRRCKTHLRLIHRW